jgi:dihydroorotate dehydrogenase electron transfer subunit
MACGIGVCMSCVCKTKKDNKTEYSRVCKDGPIFDIKDIILE